MPKLIRTALAATASIGVLALTPTSAQAAAPTALTDLITPSSAATPVAAPAAPAATPAVAAAPAATPHLSKHERKVRRHHRKQHRRVHHIDHALRVAAHQKGDPYVYGATGPSAFDCSGLMLYSFRAAGLSLPRTAAAQSGAVRHIARNHMHRGDMVFFTSGGHVYHVGIFDGWSHGRRMMIDAPHTGTDVRREAIWSNSWFPGTMRIA